MLLVLLTATSKAQVRQDLRYDQQTYLQTHNSYANPADGFVASLFGLNILAPAANQNGSLTWQLDRGVRAVNLDAWIMRQRIPTVIFGVWPLKGRCEVMPSFDAIPRDSALKDIPAEVYLAHDPGREDDAGNPPKEGKWGYLLTDGRPFRLLRAALIEIKEWLDKNPNEVVTISFESYIKNTKDLNDQFVRAGLQNYIFYPVGDNPRINAKDGSFWNVKYHGWPMIKDMVAAGKRLVVFSDKDEDTMGYQGQSIPPIAGDGNVFIKSSASGDAGLDLTKCFLDSKGNDTLGKLEFDLFEMVSHPKFLLAGPDYNSETVLDKGLINFNSVNASAEIKKRLQAILPYSLRYPNFLTVDHFHKGDKNSLGFTADSGPLEVLQYLNVNWNAMVVPTAEFTLLTPPNQNGWLKAGTRVRLSGQTPRGVISKIVYARHEAGSCRGNDEDTFGKKYSQEGDRLELEVNSSQIIAFDVYTKDNSREIPALSRSDRKSVTLRVDGQAPEFLRAEVPAPPSPSGWYQNAAFLIESLDKGSCAADTSGVVSVRASVNGKNYASNDLKRNYLLLDINQFREGINEVQYETEDLAGNIAKGSGVVRVDRTAPVTTARLSATPNAAGWINKAVTLTLAGTDAASGMGKIFYRVNGQAAQEYTGPVTISQDGNYTIQYRSADRAGNEEIEKTLSFKLDLIRPGIICQSNRTLGLAEPLQTVEVTLGTPLIQEASGNPVDVVGLRSDGLAVTQPFPLGLTNIQWIATDIAGNTNSCQTNITVVRNGAGSLANASAASFALSIQSPDSIVSAFGTNLAAGTQIATQTPLPTDLGGTRIRIRGADNVERLAPLFFVSPNQINYLMPGDLPPGLAIVTVNGPGGSLSIGSVQVSRIAPAIFSANTTGQGVPAAVLLRVRADGMQVYEPVARFDNAAKQFLPAQIDVSNSQDQVFLLLFGTGIRGRSSLGNVVAKIGETPLPMLYAGPQGSLVGLDQLNLQLPASLAGRGDADLVLVVDGKAANLGRLNFR